MLWHLVRSDRGRGSLSPSSFVFLHGSSLGHEEDTPLGARATSEQYGLLKPPCTSFQSSTLHGSGEGTRPGNELHGRTGAFTILRYLKV